MYVRACMCVCVYTLHHVEQWSNNEGKIEPRNRTNTEHGEHTHCIPQSQHFEEMQYLTSTVTALLTVTHLIMVTPLLTVAHLIT